MTSGGSKDSTESAQGSLERRQFLKVAGTGAAMATGALAGCAGSKNNEGQGTTEGGTTTTVGSSQQQFTIRMFSGMITESKTNKQYLEGIVKDFESKNPNVTVELVPVAWENFPSKFQSALAAGNPPHLAEVQSQPQVMGGGSARDISDVFEGSKTAERVGESVMELNKDWSAQAGFPNGLTQWPIGIRPHVPIWRMDWLEQAGISREDVDYRAGSLSWDKVRGMYQKLKNTSLGKKKGHYPSATGMSGFDAEFLTMYIHQFGGSRFGVISEDGKSAAINTSEAKSAIQMQVDGLKKGYFHQNALQVGDEQSTTYHWSGQIADNHIQDSADAWASYLNEKEQMMKNLRFAWGLPYNSGTASAFTWASSVAFIDGPWKNQQHLQAAADFLDSYAGNPDRMLQNAKTLGFVPIDPTVIKNDDWFGQSEMHKQFWRGAMVKTLEEAELSTVAAVPGAAAAQLEIPGQMYKRIVNQGWGVDKATKWAAQEIDDTLQRSG